MALTRTERERLSDSRLKLQSVAKSLTHVDPRKVRNYQEIRECLDAADQSLNGALRSGDPDSQE